MRSFTVTVNGSQYQVEVAENAPLQGGAPAPAPVATPVAAPVAVPVTAPVAVPVAAPVAVPVAAPVAIPVAAPVAVPAPVATAAPVAAGGQEVVTSPMPGNIWKVLVAVGDVVVENQPVVILEAMKMENEIVASKAGTITAIHVLEGAIVSMQAPLVTIQ